MFLLPLVLLFLIISEVWNVWELSVLYSQPSCKSETILHLKKYLKTDKTMHVNEYTCRCVHGYMYRYACMRVCTYICKHSSVFKLYP